MRAAFLSFLLAGCAANTPCPPLPELGAGDDPVAYAEVLATLYARCAGAAE